MAARPEGDWAGEIGQTQFLPSSYVKYAVTIDGRGHADLVRNQQDVLASTAIISRATAGSAARAGVRSAEFRRDPGME